MPKGVHNNHLSGPRHPRWIGGRVVDRFGYVYINVGRGHPLANSHGYALESALVVAAAYGADKVRKKLIHHRNEIRDDDRYSNLRPCATRGEHNHIHCPSQPRAKNGRWVACGRKKRRIGEAENRGMR
jgi:hypothetical protein